MVSISLVYYSRESAEVNCMAHASFSQQINSWPLPFNLFSIYSSFYCFAQIGQGIRVPEAYCCLGAENQQASDGRQTIMEYPIIKCICPDWSQQDQSQVSLWFPFIDDVTTTYHNTIFAFIHIRILVFPWRLLFIISTQAMDGSSQYKRINIYGSIYSLPIALLSCRYTSSKLSQNTKNSYLSIPSMSC